jgi:AcrR family transcriptional regulator
MRMSTPSRRRVENPAPASRMRKADRKQQLLAHAKALFVTLGYQETTTEKIARAAGVTEPVLYRHFDSKKALFLEVLQEVRQATINRWYAETADLTDPLAKLNAIFDMYLGATREHAVDFRIMHRTLVDSNDEEISACLRSFYLESESLLATIIAEGQKKGIFLESLDPRVGAWEMIRTALGYSLTLPLAIPLYYEPDYLAKAIECVLGCVLKSK